MRSLRKNSDPLKFEGWANLLHGSIRKNLNTGKMYCCLLDERKGAYMLNDLCLYGAFLSIGEVSRFWVKGTLNFRTGWYLNIDDLMLLDAEGTLKSIRERCPLGFIESLSENEAV